VAISSKRLIFLAQPRPRKNRRATLKELGPDIQWVESYVANDQTFCVYLAKDEALIHEHARRSIDPTTATEA
jgi:hypothetical protein